VTALSVQRLSPDQIDDALSRRAATAQEAPAGRPAREPWTPKDAKAAGGLAGAGLLGLALCWYEISGLNRQDPQMTAVVLGIAAAVLTGGACVMWLLAGLRAVRTRAHHTRLDIRSAVADLVNAQPVWRQALLAEQARVQLLDTGPVTAAGMTRYHRATCQLMRGKPPLPVTPDLVACGMCQP
jgi:hypothetical protein